MRRRRHCLGSQSIHLHLLRQGFPLGRLPRYAENDYRSLGGGGTSDPDAFWDLSFMYEYQIDISLQRVCLDVGTAQQFEILCQMFQKGIPVVRRRHHTTLSPYSLGRNSGKWTLCGRDLPKDRSFTFNGNFPNAMNSLVDSKTKRQVVMVNSG